MVLQGAETVPSFARWALAFRSRPFLFSARTAAQDCDLDHRPPPSSSVLRPPFLHRPPLKDDDVVHQAIMEISSC